jgi:hypothetical protein
MTVPSMESKCRWYSQCPNEAAGLLTILYHDDSSFHGNTCTQCLTHAHDYLYDLGRTGCTPRLIVWSSFGALSPEEHGAAARALLATVEQ